MSDRLDEIEARASAATPGPWEVCRGGWAAINHGPDSILHAYYEGECECCGSEVATSEAGVSIAPEDAEFIAHARTDIPWLVKRVHYLDTELRGALQQQNEYLALMREIEALPLDLLDTRSSHLVARDLRAVLDRHLLGGQR